ncbi:unnamed protein product, partial [Protopolystoma xenopodis]
MDHSLDLRLQVTNTSLAALSSSAIDTINFAIDTASNSASTYTTPLKSIEASQAATVDSQAIFSATIGLAASLGAPRPLDEITGFESGVSLDRESNVIVLTGLRGVYAVALQCTEEMFKWADQ